MSTPIHVGNLEENEHIPRILKLALEARYGQPFITERWGRGVYWRWIGFLARANCEAKPVSSHVSFGCAKYFISIDSEEGLSKCGLQVERGYLKAPRGCRDWQKQLGWDWNRLVQSMRPGSFLAEELGRLASEWAWSQVYHPMTESDVGIASGPDLVDSMLAVFDEVTAVLNLCMQIELPRAPR